MEETILNQLIEGFKDFGKEVSYLINFLLLTIVYFISVGLTFLLVKIFNYELLKTKPKKNTYWEELNLSEQTFEDCCRQF